MKYTNEQMQKAVQMVKDGSSYCKATKAIGATSPSIVRNWCLRNGIKSNRPSTKQMLCENCGKKISNGEIVFQINSLAIFCLACGKHMTHSSPEGSWVVSGEFVSLSVAKKRVWEAEKEWFEQQRENQVQDENQKNAGAEDVDETDCAAEDVVSDIEVSVYSNRQCQINGIWFSIPSDAFEQILSTLE